MLKELFATGEKNVGVFNLQIEIASTINCLIMTSLYELTDNLV